MAPFLRLSDRSPTETTIWIVADGLPISAHTMYALNLYRSDGSLVTRMNDVVGGGGPAGYFNSSAFAVTGLSPGTTYYFYVNARETVNTPVFRIPTTGYFSATTKSSISPPSTLYHTVSSIGGRSARINFSGGSGSDNFVVEVRKGSPSGAFAYTNYSVSKFASYIDISGELEEYTTYHVKTYGSNSKYNGGSDTSYFTTQDITSPNVNIISSNSSGTMYISFSASDTSPPYGGNMSGLREYALFISNANSTAFPSARYDTVTNTSLKYYTFTSAGNGNAFISGASYRMGIRSIDNAGNQSALSYIDVVYKSARPANWGWWTTKNSGGTLNIQAEEWNSLGRAINLFENYKGVRPLSTFDSPNSGSSITAHRFNQYRNAIAYMTSASATPTTKSSGDTIFASDLNKLVSALNSIT